MVGTDSETVLTSTELPAFGASTAALVVPLEPFAGAAGGLTDSGGVQPATANNETTANVIIRRIDKSSLLDLLPNRRMVHGDHPKFLLVLRTFCPNRSTVLFDSNEPP
jgi:hypothetical protein